MAISVEIARQFFKNPENALGKTVDWNDDEFNGLYHITGVFEKPPANATAQYDVLLNYDLFFEKRPGLQNWDNSDPSTFVLLNKGISVTTLNDKIANFIKSKDQASQKTLFLQRYSGKYLHSRYENGRPAGGRIEYVKLFSIIALFILVIACINFMNLSTARASVRFREVGIKKAIGAGRKTLVLQFLGESVFVAFLSLGIAVILIEIFLPQFNAVTGKHLSLKFNENLLLLMPGIALLTGMLSGSYPAFYLSGFRPVVALKGKIKSSSQEAWVRKTLVIFQFAISVILIVSVMVVYKQIEFIQSKNLGYNHDHLVHFEIGITGEDDAAFYSIGGKLEQRVGTFLNEAKKIPGITQACNYYHDLTGNHGGLGGMDWEAGDQDENYQFSNLEVGYNFIETMGIGMQEGRAYSRDFSPESERSKIIFNEEAIQLMGIKDPVGKTIRLWGEERQIIGVTKNFNFESLFENIKPCVIQLEPRATNIMVKIKAGTEAETLDRLQKLYEEFDPGLTFDYRFMDQEFQALYAGEHRVGVLSRYFAGLAVLISCLGLFGLAAFTAERRIKEIGIRKILGSSSLGIIRLLSVDFTRLVILAVVISLPLSYLSARLWLESFAYRIRLLPWYFLGAGAIALLIAWLTVASQALRAAGINPSECLKEE